MSNSLYQLVLRQKAELRRPLSEPIVGRESLTTLLDALESPLVKIIIGPRRCGKSTLAKLVMRGKACAVCSGARKAQHIPSRSMHLATPHMSPGDI